MSERTVRNTSTQQTGLWIDTISTPDGVLAVIIINYTTVELWAINLIRVI